MDRVAQLEAENAQLRALLTQHGIEAPESELQPANEVAPFATQATVCPIKQKPTFMQCPHGLSKDQVERYSRHLLLPAVGVAAQERLCKGSVLIVGCGGLGSPAALYLAAAGVGKIGLVDHDVVDASNLHRQVIHREDRVGQHKALSAAATCQALNSLVQVVTHTEGFTPVNALDLVSQYDVVMDASDNPPTRYLVSDACVVAGRPLVSAAAVGTDGQLTVYHHGQDGPCYRCLFPESPAPENCSRCADAGVLGPVPGVMGVLQALEVIKLLGGIGSVMSRKLMIYDALASRFTTVKLRARRPECAACGDHPTIGRDNLATYDYTGFTGQAATDGPLPAISIIDKEARITATELQAALAGSTSRQPAANNNTQTQQDDRDVGSRPGTSHVPFRVLDVRPKPQVDVLAFPGAIHIPFEQLDKHIDEIRALTDEAAACGKASTADNECSSGNGQEQDGDGRENSTACAASGRLIVLCRRGNNSQRVVARLRQLGLDNVTDVVGGVEEWIRQVDTSLPQL